MNTPYQPRQPKSSGAGSEILLAFFLLIAFVQIALCFRAGAGLVGDQSFVHLDSTVSTLDAGARLVHGTNSLTNAQPSGFHSVPTRG